MPPKFFTLKQFGKILNLGSSLFVQGSFGAFFVFKFHFYQLGRVFKIEYQYKFNKIVIEINGLFVLSVFKM